RLIGQERPLQTVEEVMNREPITVKETESLSSAIKTMRDARVDSLLVVDADNCLKGSIDIEIIDEHYKESVTISDVMKTDIFTVKSDVLLRDTVQRILRRGMPYAPVVDDSGKLLGIVTRSTIVNIVYDSVYGEEETLVYMIFQKGCETIGYITRIFK